MLQEPGQPRRAGFGGFLGVWADLCLPGDCSGGRTLGAVVVVVVGLGGLVTAWNVGCVWMDDMLLRGSVDSIVVCGSAVLRLCARRLGGLGQVGNVREVNRETVWKTEAEACRAMGKRSGEVGIKNKYA